LVSNLLLHTSVQALACTTSKLAPTPAATSAAPTSPSVLATELLSIEEPATAVNTFNSPDKESLAILLDLPKNTMIVRPEFAVASFVSSLAKSITLFKGRAVASVVNVILTFGEDAKEKRCQMRLSAVSEARRDTVFCWP
jgi:hypothetical protein